MPFINVKIAGPQLESSQIGKIQKGITGLMAEILHKQFSLTAILVEQVAASSWSIGAETAPRAAHVDATISEGTNTPEEKARFIASTNDLLREVLGPDLPVATYVVIHDVPKNGWGYGGLTQEYRATASASA